MIKEKQTKNRELVNVLVASPIDKACLDQIVATSDRINVRDVHHLLVAEYKGDLVAKEQLDAALAEAEVIYTVPWRIPKNIITRAPKFKWIQLMSAGFDRLLDSDIFRSPVIVTGVSGIHAITISEHVLQFMLMFVKNAPLCFRLKQEKQWKPFYPSVLHSKTVGIVGVGSIGREIAGLSKAFGMRVIAIRRSPVSHATSKYIDIMLPREELPKLLSESDFVVLSLPLTPETRGLIGRKELQMMKPSSYLINVARGGIVDEAALICALEENWIAGAGVDVFTTEPLPIESKFWNLPNLIFSPHSSGGMDDYYQRTTDVFCENITRYMSGEKLHNMIDKKKGY